MTGLLLLVIAAIWVVVATSIATLVARRIGRGSGRILTATFLSLILIPFPLADEIIGKRQFTALCEEHGRKEGDFSRARGMVLVGHIDAYSPVEGTLLKTSVSIQTLVDPATGKAVITFNQYRSEGGWLIRKLGISESDAPLLFDSTCGPFAGESLQDWLDRYQIRVKFN